MPNLRVIPSNAISTHPLIEGWTLYHLPVRQQGGSILWQPFKIMLDPGRPTGYGPRYAFALGWSPVECRFARCESLARLQREHAPLYAVLEIHMSLTYDRAWLETLYTPAEIEAEARRLVEARLAAKARAAEPRK